MAISSLLLAGVLAMGPQWSIVDLPYPELEVPKATGGSTPSAEVQVGDSIAAWLRKAAPYRKHEVMHLRVVGSKATARVVFPERTWIIYLERIGEEWKVVDK